MIIINNYSRWLKMVDNLEEFLPLVNAINELIDDLVVSGGLAQYF